MKAILENYPEPVLALVCSPVHGLASKLDYFPSLKQIKSFCDDKAFEISEHERREDLEARVRASAKPAGEPKPDPYAGCYTGPIELAKPGDRISWKRVEEYREFMQREKGMTNIRLWGLNEKWIDSGARPFAPK